MVDVELFVNGESRRSTELNEIRDPALPDHVVGRMMWADSEVISEGINGAAEAFEKWSSLTAQQRSALLKRAIDAATEDAELLRSYESLLTAETGKILHESRIDFAVFRARWQLTLDLADEVETVTRLPEQAGGVVTTDVSHAPLGVVVIIVPYNWPLAILAASLPAALLAGNTVIVKPPTTAPLATTLFVSRLAQSLPPGVLSVVVGSDKDIETLVTNQTIAKVAFTGSVATGAKLMALCAPKLGRLTLELGGNDAAIVCEDALLDETHLARLFHAMFDTTGQICMNIKRVYVHSSRFNELIDGLEHRLHNIVLGHGLDAKTTHGPVHSAQLAERLESMLAQAEAGGATVKRFGSLPLAVPGQSPGHFVRPALVIDPPADARVVVEEQFGPIIPIMRFESEQQALDAANDTWAGLGGSVWSADEIRARNLAKKMVAGYVWVNDHGAARLDLRAPFGGWRHSGFGREQGLSGVRDFMDTRTVAITRSTPT